MNNLIAAYLSNKAYRSQGTIMRSLHSFMRFCHPVGSSPDQRKPEEIDVLLEKFAWSSLKAKDLIKYIAALERSNKSQNTINLYLNTVRGVLKKANELSDELPEHSRISDTKLRSLLSVRIQRAPIRTKGYEVEEAELTQILDTQPGDTAAACRNRALLMTMARTGVRASELIDIAWEREQLSKRQQSEFQSYIKIRNERWYLCIFGKGSKERTIGIHSSAQLFIEEWLRVRGHAPGPLFNPVRKNDIPSISEGLSPSGLDYIIKEAIKRSGITKTFTPHDLRRAFCTQVLRETKDLSFAQKLMGHDDPSTTQRYNVASTEEQAESLEGVFNNIERKGES